MLKHRVSKLMTGVGLIAALLLSIGCSSSKPYTLVAQLLPVSQSKIVAATIDVNGSACSVRVMLAGSTQPWTPVCLVNKDQSGFKSFTIGGTQVDFGAVANGFKVLSATLPTLPAPTAATSAAPAAAAPTGGTAKPASVPAQTTADSSAAVAAATFPDQWSLSPYPGIVKLQGQNLGFLITSATLDIHGSQGTLDVTFKASYSPLHLVCTVISNAHGDFNLIFNPVETSKLTGGGNYNIQLVSEGQSISGNVWDSHGFDSWTPGLPPQWVATSVSSN
ncbi:MAG TPA: hypothetical protein VF117_03635 [Gammaproteobacteria bacterium]